MMCKHSPPPPRGCAGGTRFLRPRGTSPLKGANLTGDPGYRNGTESFFGLKGASVGCVGCINSQLTRPSDET